MRRLSLLTALGLGLAQGGGALADMAGANAPSISAEIKVATPFSSGTCPRPVNVRALIRVDSDDNGLVPVGYRFLKNGAPVTPWRTLDADIDQTLTLREMVEIDASDSRTISPPAIRKAQSLVRQTGTYRTKPTIGIEARIGNAKAHATAIVPFRCLGDVSAARGPSHSGARPDLTVAGALRIGDVAVRSGGSIVLRNRDVLARGPRGCTFRFSYDVANTGGARAPTHTSRVTRGALPVATVLTPPLDSQRTRTVAGRILLPPGDSTIRVRLDPLQSVIEESEANNVFSARVSVPSVCRRLSSPLAAPAGTPPTSMLRSR